MNVKIKIIASINLNDTDLKNLNLRISVFLYLFIYSRKNYSFSNVFLHGFIASLRILMCLSDCMPRRVSTRIKIFECPE